MSHIHYTTLARGFLGVSDQELYVCPSSKSVLVKNVIYVNTHSADVISNLIHRKSGSTDNSYLFPFNLILHTQESAEQDEIQTLQPGDSLRGSADVDAVMTYVVNGILKDIL